MRRQEPRPVAALKQQPAKLINSPRSSPTCPRWGPSFTPPPPPPPSLPPPPNATSTVPPWLQVKRKLRSTLNMFLITPFASCLKDNVFVVHLAGQVSWSFDSDFCLLISNLRLVVAHTPKMGGLLRLHKFKQCHDQVLMHAAGSVPCFQTFARRDGVLEPAYGCNHFPALQVAASNSV